jgi:penicillin amidase
VAVDAGNWDNSRAIHSPGWSGDPDNRHDCDLVKRWLNGDYIPCSIREKMQASVPQRILLSAVR